jgi:putative peptidoglycan lipid II flippase
VTEILPEKLLKSVFSFSTMTLISRVTGLVRDILLARLFGASVATDAFFVAFKIPNFLRRLFAEGAFSQAFVPVLSATRATEGRAAVRDLVAHASGTLGLILLVLSLFGVIAAPVVISIFGAGFLMEGNADKFALSVEMLRFTFPYILFISLAALAAGILNTYRQFAIPAFTPVFLNLVLIIAAVGVSPYLDEPVMALAGGVFVAGVVQLGFQLPAIHRLGLLPRPRWGWRHEGVTRIRKLMLPAIFGSSVVQINLLIDTLIASFLVTGSISWLYYSDRLVEFPLGVFGIALSTVILPGLSQRHAKESVAAFSSLMDWALRWAVLIGIPSAVGLFVLSGPMITTLFAYEQFGVHDIEMSRLSLMAYAIGLPGFIFVKVLAPGFFARQDTRTPVKAAIAAMLANVSLNLLFVGGLLWAAFEGVHAGLALATGLGAYVNSGLLLLWLKRGAVYSPHPGWLRFAFQVFSASFVMGLILWYFSGDVGTWYLYDFWQRVFWLLVWVIAGVLIFTVLMLLTGMRPGQMMRPREGF